MFEDDPYAVLDSMRGADGEVVFEGLEDQLLAKWEQELKDGAEPDLEEGLSDDEKKKLAKERAKYTVVNEKAQQANVKDDFTKVAEKMKTAPTQKPDSRMDSKFVTPGSLEDAALTAASALRRGGRRGGGPTILGEDVTRGRRR